MNQGVFLNKSLSVVGIICATIFILLPLNGIAQIDDSEEKKRIEALERQIKEFYGVEKLDALIDVSKYYSKISGKKSTRYAKQAVILAEEIFILESGQFKSDPANRLPDSYLQLGQAYYYHDKFIDSKETFENAGFISEKYNYSAGVTESENFLEKIDSLARGGQEIKRGFLSQSFKSLELKEKVSKTTLDWNINQKISAAENHIKKYEYDDAILDFEEAINLLKNKGDEEQTNILKDRIAEIKRLQNINEEVIDNYNDAIAEQERIVDDLTRDRNIADTLIQVQDQGDNQRAESVLDIENLELKSDSLIALADAYLEQQDYDRAEEYRLLFQQVEDEITKRENAETQLTLLRQQKRLAELDLQTKNMELGAQRKAKQNFIFGIGLLLALAMALLTLYITKQRSLKKLSSAYQILEEIKSKLAIAEGNIRKLLRQQVSEDIAIELMEKGTSLSTKKSFVCIMFLDIRDFTTWAEKRDPEEIIDYQNKVFGFMIDIVNEYNGNINQLLGDGFMATFGAPKSRGNDCQNAFEAALKIIQKLNGNLADKEITNTKIGIGLHAGYVVTGNVGTELRKQYSITGNTVILASRLEQLNKKYRSQLIISREVHDKLEEFNGEVAFKEVQVKGREAPVEILTVA